MSDIQVVSQVGDHIADTAGHAVQTAIVLGRSVTLCHNDHQILVYPDATIDGVINAVYECCRRAARKYAESPEGKAAAAEQAREQAEQEAREAAGPVHDREAMIKSAVPWPATAKELEETIAGYVNGTHTYDTAALAMSLAATAAFNYVAKVLGTTGFQAGCAVADFKHRNG
jgi:Cu2+-containing amine oxidase